MEKYETMVSETYEKLRHFLAVPKDYNNIKQYNVFNSGVDPMVSWHPELPCKDNKLLRKWRRLTYAEFIEWYSAERAYCNSNFRTALNPMEMECL